jgi:hypothetical protein
MDPSQPGAQSIVSVPGPQDISIPVMFGDSAGDLEAFNFKLVYDDTRLTPITGGGGTLNGNPDFNESALGGNWTCSVPSGSATPDIDPAAGPGHRVAFISCYTTGSPVAISAQTIIATLRLHVVASGTSSVAISEAAFFHPGDDEIGSCNPVIAVEMTCVDGSVSAP